MTEEREEKREKREKQVTLSIDEILRQQKQVSEITSRLAQQSQAAFSMLRIPAIETVIARARQVEEALAPLQESFRRMSEWQKIIAETIGPAIEAAERSKKIFETMSEFQLQVSRMEDILPSISELPSRQERMIESLLNYIAVLESELSKEKEKNKELLEILELTKKKLEGKPEYIR